MFEITFIVNAIIRKLIENSKLDSRLSILLPENQLPICAFPIKRMKI
jgi:hypothetical protein